MNKSKSFSLVLIILLTTLIFISCPMDNPSDSRNDNNQTAVSAIDEELSGDASLKISSIAITKRGFDTDKFNLNPTSYKILINKEDLDSPLEFGPFTSLPTTDNPIIIDNLIEENWQADIIAYNSNDKVIGVKKEVSVITNVDEPQTYSLDMDVSVPILFGEKQVFPTNNAVSNRMGFFGASLSIDGDTIVVGDDFGEDNSSYSVQKKGNVHIFKVDDNDKWNLEEYLESTENTNSSESSVADNLFGKSVALSQDTAIVGDALAGDKGKAFIYTRDSSQDWQLNKELSPSDSFSGKGFGYCVAIHDDIAVVSAFDDDISASTNGSVYIYLRDENGEWEYKDELVPDDLTSENPFNYGNTVDIYDNKVVVGAIGGKNNSDQTTGSAYIFTLSEDLNTYTFVKILPKDGKTNGKFGYSVDIYDDKVILGAIEDNGIGNGTAYIFECSEGENWIEKTSFSPENSIPNGCYSNAVAIWDDYAVVGLQYGFDDNNNGTGIIYIYNRDPNDESWSYYTKLFSSDGFEGDRFGYSVALANKRVVVSALENDNEGSVYIYDLP